METFRYASRVDGSAPLLADVAFQPGGAPQPLLVVMHGYNGSRRDVRKDIEAFAARGLFALAPDMRGAGESGGTFDSGGVEIHDIVDAVLECLTRYPGAIDPRNLNLVGFSGGGGNAIACAVRFPDFFQTCVSFFGISDSARFIAHSSRPDCIARMTATLGGTPEQAPDAYAARDFCAAAGNVCAGTLRLVWDAEETQCPPLQNTAFLASHRQAGLDRVTAHVSAPGDAHRYIHGYRAGSPGLEAADALYLPDVLAPKAAPPLLPGRGRLVVPGYLVTRCFQVWVEDGRRGRVTVEYDLRGPSPRVVVSENPGKLRVRIETTSPLAPALPRSRPSPPSCA